MNICVFGAASDDIKALYKEETEALCRKLGEAGHDLIYGGGATGLMGAASRGFREANRRVISVVPKFFLKERIEEIDPEYTKLIRTRTMRDRKKTMEDKADAFLIVPGGIGTFEEFFEVLTLRKLGRHDKKIVVFGIDGYYKELENLLSAAAEKGFIRGSYEEYCLFTDDAGEVYAYFTEGEQ